MDNKIYPVSALGRTTIPLGRQMDNGVRRILFEVAEWLQEYPSGTITLCVMPPIGDVYPAKIDMEGGMAVWKILESDTAQSGRGMVQIKLIGKNGEKLHSANAFTMIEPSIAANAGGKPPNAAKPWFDQIMELLIELKGNGVSDEQIAAAVEAYLAKNPIEGITREELENAIKPLSEQIAAKVGTDQLNTAVQTALTAAKESGEFKGDPGYTPQKGVDYFDGAPGEPGKDGKDGKDGAPGPAGPAGADGKDYVLTDEDKREIAGMIEMPDDDENASIAIENWEIIIDHTFEEDVSSADFTTDINGETFALRKILVFLIQTPISGQTVNNRFGIGLNGQLWGGTAFFEAKPSPKETEKTVYTYMLIDTVDGNLYLERILHSFNYSEVTEILSESAARNNYMSQMCLRVNTKTNEIRTVSSPCTSISISGIASVHVGKGSRILVKGVRS